MDLESPFASLRALLDNITPATKARVLLDIGSPQHTPPAAVLASLTADTDYAAYPPLGGLPEFHKATRGWLARRFDLDSDFLASLETPLPLAGTREGLFLAAQLAPTTNNKNQFLIPTPFYQLYAAAALAAARVNAAEEVVQYLASDAKDFLPCLDAIEKQAPNLRALYFCHPTNPQGATASRGYLQKLLALAIKYNFLLLVDECYIDIYDTQQPSSMLEIMNETNNLDAPVLIFHSLSKRSNLAGLRSGFVVGGTNIMQEFLALRLLAGTQSPAPVQRAAALAWGDDAHAADNRAQYRAKIDLAERIFCENNLDDTLQFYRPAGGFFLWLNVAALGGGEAVAKSLWRDNGVRVLPGLYLGAGDSASDDASADYIRIALCASPEMLEAGLIALCALADKMIKGRAA